MAMIAIVLVGVAILYGNSLYKSYEKAKQKELCDDITLSTGDKDFVVHPFAYNGRLVVVIPMSWNMDSIVVTYRGDKQPSKLCRTSEGILLSTDSEIWGGQKLMLYKSRIASIQIDTESGTMDAINASSDKSVSEGGWMKVVNKNGKVEYDGKLKKIKGRGNGTWRQNSKKPYNITLSNKVDLLGLKRAKKYCLLADDKDPSHLKNWLAYNIAKELGTEYPVDCEHVAVWYNGHYGGLYLLTNNVDIAKSSVAVRDLEEETEIVNAKKLGKYPLFDTGDDYTDSWECFPKVGSTIKGIEDADNPEDISGGYLLDHAGRLFSYASAESGFVTSNRWTVMIKSPKYATREQVEYIRSVYEEMDKAISAIDGYGEDGRYYTEYIDLHSFVTYFLCQEVLANHDGGLGSVTLFKPEDSISSRIFAGPVWDFDVSFSSGTSGVGYLPRAYLIAGGLKGCPNDYKGILGEVAKHADFMDSVKVCYINNMRPILENYLFSTQFDKKRTEIAEDAKYNAMLWGKSLTGYMTECNKIVDFMRERISFIDKDWVEDGFDHTITLDVGWNELPLPYHLITLKVKDGECINDLPLGVDLYYNESQSHKGLGWYNASTDEKYDSTKPVTEDITLAYRWDRISDFDKFSVRAKSAIIRFFSSLK